MLVDYFIHTLRIVTDVNQVVSSDYTAVARALFLICRFIKLCCFGVRNCRYSTYCVETIQSHRSFPPGSLVFHSCPYLWIGAKLRLYVFTNADCVTRVLTRIVMILAVAFAVTFNVAPDEVGR